ncbi:hypothetical protein SAMN02910456_01156 [Ruminococcaceae bacterium YRB3002]|nr:hypothetical protein SAMN02910456_01156 [Ruminococcaceae bacterium YRB3002]
MSRMLFSYLLFEAKIHSGATTILFTRIHMLIVAFMERVIKLNYMKSAFVYIEVNVSGLKIWSECFPHAHFRVYFLNLTPCTISDSFAMVIRQSKQEIEKASVFFNMDYNTTGDFAVTSFTKGNSKPCL